MVRQMSVGRPSTSRAGWRGARIRRFIGLGALITLTACSPALDWREVRPPDAAHPQEAQLAESGMLLRLDGVHFADDAPLACETRLISLSAVPEIADQPFDAASPGAWLLAHVPWTEAETRIAATGASREVAARLDQPAGAPCLFIERRTWRGTEGITLVRQHFVASAYDLIARFGPARSANP